MQLAEPEPSLGMRAGSTSGRVPGDSHPKLRSLARLEPFALVLPWLSGSGSDSRTGAVTRADLELPCTAPQAHTGLDSMAWPGPSSPAAPSV